VPEQNIEWARESAARTPEKGLGKATPEVIDGSGACQSPALDCRCSLNRLEPLFSGRAGKKRGQGKKGAEKTGKAARLLLHVASLAQFDATPGRRTEQQKSRRRSTGKCFTPCPLFICLTN